jgi:hypothetical protein
MLTDRALRKQYETTPPGTVTGVSSDRDELRRLVDNLPEERLPDVLAEVRRHLTPASDRPWPPAWFGAGHADRTDTAARAEEILREEGFGRSR